MSTIEIKIEGHENLSPQIRKIVESAADAEKSILNMDKALAHLEEKNKTVNELVGAYKDAGKHLPGLAMESVTSGLMSAAAGGAGFLKGAATGALEYYLKNSEDINRILVSLGKNQAKLAFMRDPMEDFWRPKSTSNIGQYTGKNLDDIFNYFKQKEDENINNFLKNKKDKQEQIEKLLGMLHLTNSYWTGTEYLDEADLETEPKSVMRGVGSDVLLGGGGGDGLFGGLTQGFEEATGRMRDNWEMMNTQMAGDTEACLGGISSQFGQTLGVDLGGQMTTLEQRFGQAAQGMSRQGSQSAKLIDLVFRRSLGQSIPGQMQALGHGWLGVLGRMGADNSQYFGGLEQLSQSVLGGQIPSQMQGLVGNWQGGVGSMEALGQRLFSYIELGAQETLGMVFSGEISNLGGLWDQVLSGMESTLVWLKRRTGEVRSALRQALKTNSPCFSPMAPILQP
jgi:hypothetical protein